MSAPSHRTLPLLAAAALVLLLPSPAARAERNDRSGLSERQDRFEEEAQVFAVEVPVQVTGRDGRPVRGLTAADFEVWDEGKAQAITDFEVVDLAGPAAVPSGTPARSAPVDPAARRRILLLFDLSFSSPTAILKARLAARDFLLHSLDPSDLVAVATFSLENGPRLVMTFTPDRAQLARAIDTLGTRRDARADSDPLRFLIEAPLSGQGAQTGEGDTAALARAKTDAALVDHLMAISLYADKLSRSFERSRNTAMTRSLGDLARWLDNVKGRKQVLYFSEGFDDRLLVGRTTDDPDGATDNDWSMAGRIDYVDTDNRFGNTELQGAVNRMLEEFRRADCVIDSIDVGGLRAQGDATDTQHHSGKSVLFYMARETGGELLEDSNDLGGQLGHVFDRTAVTYLLTFQRADLKPDGAYHRLRVKAKLPAGAHLSHRSGYYAPRPFAGLHPFEKSLLAADGIANAVPRRDLDLHVLAAPFRAGAGRAYVPVILEVGGKSLLEGQKGDRLNLELYAYVSDAKGEMKDFFTRTLGLDLGKDGKGRETVLATGVKYYGHLDLPPGSYRVRVLVRNAETGRTGVESLPLTVPEGEDARLRLLPPFFADPAHWLLVREPDSAAGAAGAPGQGSVIYPFTFEGDPYVPAARPRLSADDEVRLYLVAYNLGAGSPGVEGEVVTADGRPVAGGRLTGGRLTGGERTATGAAGIDKLVATFRPAGLPPGDYTLRVRVTDPATGVPEVSAAPFSVVRHDG
jgi:VWFA-related protein